ncbi:6-bladed beta-propeller [Gracilimonas sp.]|uniref:6-bladed beta-propeller n=1 Tax=Gracilimonas sp. TaxID=1974203 RepID=UPI002872A7A7|nr:6-bladed beta-propeller [Gracilimonas sp.]
MRKNLFGTLFIIVLACSCTNQPREINSNNSKELIIDIEQARTVGLSEFIQEMQYTPLKTPGNEFMGTIAKIIHNENYYGFLDKSKKSAWIYDKELNFINEISFPEGRGAGELEYFSDITFGKENTLYALGLFKFIKFDIDGELLKETVIRPQISKFVYDQEIDMLVGYMNNYTSGNLDENKVAYNLVYLDEDGTVYDMRLPIDKRKETMAFLTFENFPSYKNEHIFFSHIDFNIYRIDNFDIDVKYQLSFPNQGLTEDILNLRYNFERQSKFLNDEIRSRNVVYSIGSFLETENQIYIQYVQGRSGGYFVYNKENQESFVASKFINDIDNGSLPFLVSSDSTSYLGLIEPYDLIRHLHNLRDEEPQKFNDPKTRELISLVNTISENSNPIFIQAIAK